MTKRNDQHTPSDSDATRIMPAPNGDSTRSMSAPPEAAAGRLPTPSLGVGSVIKQRFELTRCLGEGGMSVVYQALDRRKAEARDSDPYIAIKVLSREVAEHPQAFVALQRETRKSQQLAHPNIITVFDFDRDGDTVFMTMEQLHGQTLAQLIDSHPLGLPRQQAATIIAQICRGLGYAHAKQIVHSDLKPNNVFICADGTVKLLDFGIARASAAAQAGNAAADELADFGGLTPAYASLEMFAGEPPDPADDLYSLGLVCYELLSGRHPYDRLRAPEALERGLQAKPIPGIGRRRWRAIDQALALRRAQRCASVEMFARRFRGRSKLAQALLVVTGVAAVSLVAAGYSYYSNRGPATAFSDLPGDIQIQVEAALESGRQALLFDDFNGALHFYDLADSLHPGNPAAGEGLEQVVDQVLTMQAQTGQTSTAAQLEQVETLLAYPALANDKRLQRHRSRLLERLQSR